MRYATTSAQLSNPPAIVTDAGVRVEHSHMTIAPIGNNTIESIELAQKRVHNDGNTLAAKRGAALESDCMLEVT